MVCPSGYVNFEARGWWTPKGLSFDAYRGVDAEICWPRAGFLHSGTTTFLLHIQLRKLHAPITFIRIGFGPDGRVNGFFQNVHLVPDAAGYGEWYVSAPTTANTHAGWNEYRLTANVGSDEDGQRQYQSTGLQAWTTSSSSSYRSLPWWETRGWYPATGYVNARHAWIPPELSQPVSGNLVVPLNCADGGNGFGYIDANTHAEPMVFPHTYAPSGGHFTVNTTALSNGVHKLQTRCDLAAGSGTSSAVTQYLINVQN